MTTDRVRLPEPRPTVVATIEPFAAGSSPPCVHAVRLYLPLSSFDERLADRRAVLALAADALRAIGADGVAQYFDVLVRDKVAAIEATASLADAPTGEAVAGLRQALMSAGYRVTVRATRICADAGCTTTTTVEPGTLPNGWHSAAVCGKHGYRSCGVCQSVYVMTSASTTGPAAAVHCEVCATVLVEWGASKSWTAELVARGKAS